MRAGVPAARGREEEADPMSPPAPSFPAFDDWKRMSEREQDALLDRLEARKRRLSLTVRLLMVLGAAAVVLMAGFAVLILR
jgi:hypothetical protein